ncbi:hypothetical protein [Sphingomonas ginsenosidivorax]|jgi:hypothetical protein|nr:hypothetical protein [Sphingomonas ginsenosidivorax]
MARRQDIFTLVGKRMDAPCATRGSYEAPPLADLVRRIDRALLERRAA